MALNPLAHKPFHLFKSILPELVGLTLFLGLWQWGAMRYGSVVLPSPSETWAACHNLAITGKLKDELLITSFHLMSALTLAITLGIILGMIAGLQSGFERAMSPIISAFQGVPPIGWIVLALLWFGTGNGTPIFTITVTILPILFFNTIEGIRTFPTSLLEMAHLFRTPRRILLSDLYFPHLLTYLFPALLSALGLGWRVAVMAELLSSEKGIGAALNLARINLATDEVMAWIILVVISIWISEYFFLRPLHRWLQPYKL
ncbi:MAG: ABC transporter permease [Microcystaceae cyanobacterium]